MAKTLTNVILKSPTGITGFDEITYGGLPKGRPTLICGGAGCGKTLFGMEFIVKGALLEKEPGVYVSFEEMPNEIIQNVASLGFNIPELIKKKLISLDYIHVEKSEIEETGEFNLDGLFIRLSYIIDSIGAKRIVLDTIESLFSGISNHAILRAELRRLFRWLKDRGITAIITGERGENTLTRQGLEEYVSDCVIVLDHRIEDQYSTRRLRIVKYRGSFHGTNEYPFLIGENGISVIPITSLKLQHQVTTERISTGVDSLDEMFEGKGYYKGTTVLVSGSAGSGKSSLAAHFVNSACRRGERSLYIAFEESENQILRNMKSIGINLKQYKDTGLLHFHVTRPTYYSLEMHLALIYKTVKEFNPSVIVIDPISNLTSISNASEASSLLTRLIDFLKSRRTTSLFTNLVQGGENVEKTEVGVSSIVDTWITLFDIKTSGEKNRGISIVKSRGMSHSNQVREFKLSAHGIELIDVYVGKEGILIGSSREAQMQIDNKKKIKHKEENARLDLKIKKAREIAEARIEAVKLELDNDIAEMKRSLKENQDAELQLLSGLSDSASRRQNKYSKKNKDTINGKE